MKKAGRICIMLLCICLFSLIAMGCGESGSTDTAKVYDDAREMSVDESKELVETKNPQSTSDVSTEEALVEETPIEEDPVEQTCSDEEVVVTVTGKTNIEADIYSGRYSDRVTFEIQVTNQTDKIIKGVQGVLTVDDLFGKKIMSSNCDFTGQTILPGETVTYDSIGIDVNEFKDSHVKLYNEAFGDLSFSYKVNEIVFANDGDSDSSASQTTGSKEVSIMCIDKKNIKANYSAGRFSAYSQFTFVVENKTEKTIKGVQGVVTVSDLFGRQIKRFNCDFTGQKIPAGESVTFTDKYLEINEFDNEDVKIYNEEYADLQFSYKVTDIVYDE